MAFASRRARDDGDGGFTLMEAVIALFIFGIIAAAVSGVLLNSLATGRINRDRVTAANLASRELEVTRDAFSSNAQGPRSVTEGLVVNPDPLTGGTAGQALVVNNVPFTVKRTAEWTNQSATSPCDNGNSGQLAYLRVDVAVTWPKAVKPVTATTLLTPKLGTYKNGEGSVKVKVLDQNGAPEDGVTVHISGPGTSQDIDTSNGCAFFGFLDPGTYTTSVNEPGYVDQTWSQTSQQLVTVTGNSVSNVTFAYAQAATLNVAFDTTNGFDPPTAVSVTAGNSSILPSGTLDLNGNGSPRSYPNAWPYSNGVSLWEGDCADADPQGTHLVGSTPTAYWSGAARPAAVATNPGQPTSATVTGSQLTVKVTNGTGVVQPNLTVTAVHAADSTGPCTAGETVTLPHLTDSTGTAKVLMPYGTWNLRVTGKTANPSWPSVTLDPRTGTGTSVTVKIQ